MNRTCGRRRRIDDGSLHVEMVGQPSLSRSALIAKQRAFLAAEVRTACGDTSSQETASVSQLLLSNSDAGELSSSQKEKI